MATKNKLARLTKSTAAPMPSPVTYRSSSAEKARERRYQAEDALRTLTRADEIKRDKPLMSAVKQVAREQVKTLTGVMKRHKS